MTKILVVDDDLVTLNWLQSVLQREDYVVSVASTAALALEKIEKDRPDLLVLDLMLPDRDGLDVLRGLRSDPETRDLWVVILSVKSRPEDIITGLRAGADDYVPKRPGADVELISKIRVLLAQAKRRPQTAAPEIGKLFSFCSAKGGAGTTSVCVNLAYAVAQMRPQSQVLIADMVFPIGTVGSSVGYESQETVAKLTRECTSKLERGFVEKYISPMTRWNFKVLIGAHDPQEALTLDVGQIIPLFEIVRTMFDYVFVDFGRTLSRISLPVIQVSDAIVVTLTPDINTVRMTNLTLEYLASLGVTRNRLIAINNRTVGRVWISKEETERTLGLSLAGTIPFESEYMTMAVNAGIPFMAKFPEHAASSMFTDFARMLLGRAKS